MRVDIHWRGDWAMATLKKRLGYEQVEKCICDANNIKQFLLEWLIKHGINDFDNREEIYMNGVEWHIMYHFCVDSGLLDSVQDPFTKNHHVKLTEKGLKYVKRKNNDTTE